MVCDRVTLGRSNHSAHSHCDQIAESYELRDFAALESRHPLKSHPGSVMASSAAPADLQARVSPSAEAEHFVYFSLT